jgi:4-hydroxymandelate synthase
MTVRDIEYIELCVSDMHSAVDYFVSSLGFVKVAESQDAGSNSTLLRQGSVQLVVTGGQAMADFLDNHGDGIIDIAFGCDDVDATCAAVVAQGGAQVGSRDGSPVVSGFGSVCHTLMPARERGSFHLPPGRHWAAAPGAPRRLAPRIARLDHIAVCCEAGNLTNDTDFYRGAFGLDWYSREFIEIADQAMDSIVLRSRSGGATFTMLEPDTSRRPGQLDAFLQRNNGAGVQHLAFLVDNIIATVSEFRQQGVEFLDTPDAYYDALGERCPDMREEIAALRSADVLADRDEWGYLLQLFTRSPYERNTLFFELIQRRGARGFGSANIRALYEAVERDRLTAG